MRATVMYGAGDVRAGKEVGVVEAASQDARARPTS
jgi:hypothetical protein